MSIRTEFGPATASSTAAIGPLVKRAIILCPLVGLILGGAFALSGRGDAARHVWIAATLPVLAVLCIDIVASLRRGEIGLDVIAALSMSAALLFREELAATVVALMYAGGQYIEQLSQRRARRDLTALLERVPRSVLRYQKDALVEVSSDGVLPGDRLLIRSGDVVPVDGLIGERGAVLDTSALTGESLPQTQMAGSTCESGTINVGAPFDLTATRRASDSVYAAIVRLVDEAQRTKAPMARLADRFAVAFLVLAVVMSSVAWMLSDDPVRAVAVLVVATPCPLLLAVPIALVSGMSRAAKHGILVKGARVLEDAALVSSLVLDKTGTLTGGRPEVLQIEPSPGFDGHELLRLAASLEQVSKHVVAATLVAEAKKRSLALTMPADVSETAGEGLSGTIDKRRVVVGNLGFVATRVDASTLDDRPDIGAGEMQVVVAVDGQEAGRIVLADRLREHTAALFADLRNHGIRRIVLATGDRREVAKAVAADLDLDAIEADLSPNDKVGVVRAARLHGPVMMIGDGINDAPALAAADVGVAMGPRGSAGSIETADMVLLADRLDGVAGAIMIAKRSRAIALQSVFIGIGLSTLGMLAAAFGFLPPIQGAVLQECIDVAVILNALRALRDA